VPDAGVSLGGCIVESQHGRIDQRIETQLARIEEELTRT
jgi:flagellar biosynthesis/type III secretory pathway protein FliH